MKYIVIGLGNFGSSLAEKLTRSGNEVIGVDHKAGLVDAMKGKITHVVCLNSSDPDAVTNLPLEGSDCVIVAIGENEGDNLMTTALMKQHKVKRVISRAISPLHETILEAIGVDEIVHPEAESAERWANKINLHGVVDSFELTSEFSIVEADVPPNFVGKSLEQLALRKEYHVTMLTVIQVVKERNLIGFPRKVKRILGLASAETVLNEGDTMVLFGKVEDIKKIIGE